MGEEPVKDYRSARMPTADGHGRARAAMLEFFESFFHFEVPWTELDNWEELDRSLVPFARKIAKGFSADLVGFWVLWHAEGGFEGLQRFGMSDSTIWRRVKAFRDAFGEHPDDFVFPGLSIDLGRYWLDEEGHGSIGGGVRAEPE